MVKLTHEQCLNIAAVDCNIGTSAAMDLLEEYGGDASIFWDYEINCPDDEYDDYDAIEKRDQVYELNGIYDQMQKAYEEGWY